MKYLTICLIVFSINSSLSAREKFLCSTLTLHKYKSIIPKTEFDKVKHCSYSCILSRKCGVLESFSVGVAKEIADLLGFGTPDWEDLAANRKGIKLGRRVKNIQQCLPICRDYYERGNI